MIGFGIWLFSSGYLHRDRVLVWVLERPSSLRSLEIQIYGSDGELLKREELAFPRGASGDVLQQIKLGSGSYRVQLFTRHEGDPAARPSSVELTIADEEQYVLRVPR